MSENGVKLKSEDIFLVVDRVIVNKDKDNRIKILNQKNPGIYLIKFILTVMTLSIIFI